MCKVYGYCRISRSTQNIDRQVRNIMAAYPEAVIIRENGVTGTTMNRDEWKKLMKRVDEGKVDHIIFDSVSRMSRNADEGIKTYFELFDKGVQLSFLKEAYIDTSVYAENLKDKVELQGTDEDELFKGINNYFRVLAKKQIRIAFEQAEKEVMDLRVRTKEGIETARLNGKQIGQAKDAKLNVKKAGIVKELIKKYSKDFEGTHTDEQALILINGELKKIMSADKAMQNNKKKTVSRNTYYLYKKQMKEEAI